MASPAEVCSPWVEPPDCVESASTEARELAALIASQMLFHATGRRYPGVCVDTVESCGSCGCTGQRLAYPAGGSRQITGPLCPAGCPPVAPCDFGGGEAVELPGLPVIDVVAATVDGEALADDTPVMIQDDRWVALVSGRWGPDWSITYRYGAAPPAYLARVATLLACELLAVDCDGEDCPPCHLPERVTNIVREGVSMTVLDGFEFMAQGGFGVRDVDQALATFRQTANMAADRPRMLSAAALLCPPVRRVRTVPITPLPDPDDPDFPGPGDEISGGTPDDPGPDEFSGGTPDDPGPHEFSGGTP